MPHEIPDPKTCNDPGGDWYWEEHTKVQHSCDIEEDLAPNDSASTVTIRQR